MALILGIETSCDECSASVIRDTGTLEVLSTSTFSQIEIHQPYGGVVPEIASRNHLETLPQMIRCALLDAKVEAKQLDAIAVTNRPGLVGALLVGVTAAKAMAYALNKPLIPIHHLEGHIASLYLGLNAGEALPPLPILVAVVSGGHSNLYVITRNPEDWPDGFLKSALIGKSRDDAAGEAFDKTAKVLGFPYPGGVWMDRAAKGGNPAAFELPRALPQKSTYDFSFSGLKTAFSLLVRKLMDDGTLDTRKADLCASLQEAIIDALLTKIFLAAKEKKCRSIAIVGGVSANSRLRARIANETNTPVFFPKPEYCTDNAAMIAAAGAFKFRKAKILDRQSALMLNAYAYPEH